MDEFKRTARRDMHGREARVCARVAPSAGRPCRRKVASATSPPFKSWPARRAGRTASPTAPTRHRPRGAGRPPPPRTPRARRTALARSPVVALTPGSPPSRCAGCALGYGAVQVVASVHEFPTTPRPGLRLARTPRSLRPAQRAARPRAHPHLPAFRCSDCALWHGTLQVVGSPSTRSHGRALERIAGH